MAPYHGVLCDELAYKSIILEVAWGLCVTAHICSVPVILCCESKDIL